MEANRFSNEGASVQNISQTAYFQADLENIQFSTRKEGKWELVDTENQWRIPIRYPFGVDICTQEALF